MTEPSAGTYAVIRWYASLIELVCIDRVERNPDLVDDVTRMLQAAVEGLSELPPRLTSIVCPVGTRRCPTGLCVDNSVPCPKPTPTSDRA